MKKVLVVIISLILVLSLSSCSENANDVIESKPLVVMILDKDGLGDSSLNDLSWEGCEDAKKEYEIDIRCVESASEDEYESNIQKAVNEGAMIVICPGKSMETALSAVASENPDTRFVSIDGNVDLKNVTNISFEKQEAGFLAGVAAASATTTGKVGFIGSNEGEEDEKYFYGFVAGAKSINQDIEVEGKYITDSKGENEAKILVDAMVTNEVDVIYQAAGKSGEEIIKAVSKADKWVIGSDKDQSFLASENTLCSVTRTLDTAVFKEIEKASKNKKASEKVYYTLENKGIDISDNAGNLTKEQEKTTEKWKKAIKKGKFAVPYDKESFDAFQVPEV